MTKEDLAPYADKFEAYVNDFITPLSYDKGGNCGSLCGTGSFFTKNERKYLITCAHIITCLEKLEDKQSRQIPVQCLFKENEEFVPISLTLFKKNEDLDVAIADITDIWNGQEKNDRKAFSFEKFKTTDTIDGEYFYTVGYPSFSAGMWGDTLKCPVQKFLTTESTLPELSNKTLNSYSHFALKYLPDLCCYTRSEMHLARDPAGISGSLIWNTHLTDDIIWGKQEWNPEIMTVAGVEFCWDGESCIVGTKSCAIDFNNLIDV